MSNFNQTSYTLQHAKAVAGMLADSEVNNNISKVNNSAQTIQYGRFVARDGDNGMLPLAAATTAANVLGVTRYELNRAQGLTGDVVGVPPDRDGTVVTMGAIYVESIVTAPAGAPAFAVVAQGANTGKVSNVAGADATLAVAVQGVYAEAATAGQLAKISLRIGG